MKSIPLIKATETIRINGRETEQNVSTDFLILACLDNLPDKGFTFSDLKSRRRISDVIETIDSKKKDVIDLEDSDFEVLKQCVLSMRWAVRSKFIEEFCEQFLK